MPAARKHAHTKKILLNSMDAMKGVFSTYLVNTLIHTIKKKVMEEKAVAQYNAL